MTPLLEHWDGSAWNIVPAPPPPDGSWATLAGVAAISSGNVWAVGYESSGSLLIEHWNGSAWTIASSPSPGHSSELNAVAAPTKRPGLVSRQRVFATGLFSNYDINIYDGTYTLPQTLVLHGG